MDPAFIIAIAQVVIGLVVLTKAADIFVDNSVNVAGLLKISPVVVGAVIIGFGTSAPELLVSGIAAANGNLDLGVGNVVGSNVANISLVLATAALVVPVLVTRSTLVREAPLSLLTVLLFAGMTIGGLQRWEGFLLLTVLVCVLSWIILGGHEESVQQAQPKKGTTLGHSILMTTLGLVGTVFGAQVVLWGAEATAEIFNLTGGFIGFTMVALGTSLPELVTVLAAARKNETELIIGNLLGSNIFNSLAVGGAIAVIGPGQIADQLLGTYGIVIMCIVATLAWTFMVVRRRVSKVEAIILLGVYVAAILMISNIPAGESMRTFFKSLV